MTKRRLSPAQRRNQLTNMNRERACMIEDTNEYFEFLKRARSARSKFACCENPKQRAGWFKLVGLWIRKAAAHRAFFVNKIPA